MWLNFRFHDFYVDPVINIKFELSCLFRHSVLNPDSGVRFSAGSGLNKYRSETLFRQNIFLAEQKNSICTTFKVLKTRPCPGSGSILRFQAGSLSAQNKLQI